MSVDTDDEGFNLNQQSPSLAATMASEDESTPSSEETVSTVLITANVGSIFEEPEKLIPKWHEEMVGYLAATKTQFVAMHFQEVGKKNEEEAALQLIELWSSPRGGEGEGGICFLPLPDSSGMLDTALHRLAAQALSPSFPLRIFASPRSSLPLPKFPFFGKFPGQQGGEKGKKERSC